MNTSFPIRHSLQLGTLAALLILGVGCKQAGNTAEQPASALKTAALPASSPTVPPDDQQISNDIEAKIHAESALNGQNIKVSVAKGVATLNGDVANEASRALAAAESGSVDGVKTVINNLTVASPRNAEKTAKAPRPHRQQVAKAAPARAPYVPPPPPPQQPEPVRTIAPPSPPPPVVRTVTLPAGTVIPVRMTDALDSATTQSNSIFHGSLAADLIENGMVAAPRGTPVIGRVISAKDAGHFSGNSELTIELTKLDTRNQEISVVTDSYTKKGAGRGKNTAMKSGGGAALGAIIGALAGGGKGAAIGAATGGGVGAGVNAVTRGQQVQIPSETLVNFRLQTPISITTSRSAGASQRINGGQGPQLQQPQ